MAKAQIFISHSCKDAETAGDLAPPVDPQALGRLQRLRFAKLVRDQIEQGLNADFEVLLDRRLLEPGDGWRIKLLRWLGSCRGAVILLSQESIESRWVLQEATIATWRKWLNADFELVPVMLGALDPGQLEAAGFAPTQISEIQAAKLDSPGDLSPANAAALAGQVVQRFQALAGRRAESNEMQDWVDNVATWLQDLPEDILAKTCKPLQIDVDEWTRVQDRARERALTVAHGLLHARTEAVGDALEKVSGVMQTAAFASLAAKLLPTWVDTEAASALARIQHQPRPWFALNTDLFDTARDYAQRAWCCPNWWPNRCIEFDEPVGEGQAQEALLRLREVISRQLKLARGASDAVLLTLLGRRPFFVVLGDQVAHAQTLVRLIAASPVLSSVTCLTLAGRDFERLDPDATEVLRITPALDDQAEDNAQAGKAFITGLIAP
jgi:hypothetical protein